MIKSIDCIKYGDSTLPESMIFFGGNKERFKPIIFAIYLIKTDNRNILVDAGCITMPDFNMKNFIGPIKSLREVGVKPTEISDLVLTHSHHDHVECVKFFSNAVVHIQKDEYNFCKSYIPSKMNVNKFDEQYIIDDKIKIIKIGGHSIGSCIVEVEFNDNIYVICGDECYCRENLVEKIPTGSFYDFKKSKAFVETYSSLKYITLLCHDI